MDRQSLIDQLPEAMAVALRLEEAGEGPPVIAAALGIPTEGVPMTLRLAHDKLRHLAEESEKGR